MEYPNGPREIFASIIVLAVDLKPVTAVPVDLLGGNPCEFIYSASRIFEQ